MFEGQGTVTRDVDETREELDWIEQCFTSPPTQYRLYGRRFYRSKDPTNSIKPGKSEAKARDVA